ncbi:MAG TPA: hypothetical protein VLM79_00650, partial [Kofleriaceae bacterium]|nr:hypothetical protein [Kofleriaceae bacterium]
MLIISDDVHDARHTTRIDTRRPTHISDDAHQRRRTSATTHISDDAHQRRRTSATTRISDD